MTVRRKRLLLSIVVKDNRDAFRFMRGTESHMAEIFYGLALLACPLGMGAMMWLMMRGGHPHSPEPSAAGSAELARLRAEVEQLRAEQGDRSSTSGHLPPAPIRP